VITETRLNRQAVLVLLALVGVLAYTTFQWGGVVRTGRIPSSLGPAGDVVESWSFTGRVVAASWPCGAMGSRVPASVCAVAGDPIAAAVLALYWFMWLATYELKGTKNLLASVSPEEVMRAEWDIGKCGRLSALG
jgi:hypothetical protein